MDILKLLFFTYLLAALAECARRGSREDDETNFNFYEELGLDQDCTDKEIRKAFRKLSVKYHPDKNPGDEDAAQKFLRINKAYEVLNDPNQRRIYDTQGYEGVQRYMQGDRSVDYESHNKGPDATATVSVTLEELYNGAQRETTISRNVLCPKCRGSGAKDGKTETCKACKGRGVVMQQVNMGPGFSMQMQQPCDRCGGRGKKYKHKCPHCSGRKVINGDKTLQINIEKGMSHGDKIVFPRESEQSPDWTPGDVVFTVRMSKHDRFKRIGNDLYYTQKLTLKESLLGYEKSIKQLDGREIRTRHTGITIPFENKVIKTEGMPIKKTPSQKGDLNIKFKVEFPKKLSEEQKKLVEELFPQKTDLARARDE